MKDKLMRLCVAIASVFGIGVGTLAVAQPALAAPTCIHAMHFYFNGTIQEWTVDQIWRHHFFVRLSGMPDMTGMVSSRTATIYWNDQPQDLTPWSQEGRNTWGVHTQTVVSAVLNGQAPQNNWQIRWPNGANGIMCPLG